MLSGLGDGEGEMEESRPPGGTQIITFFGGSGGECFPPGMQGNFSGWNESGDKINLRHCEGDKTIPYTPHSAFVCRERW